MFVVRVWTLEVIRCFNEPCWSLTVSSHIRLNGSNQLVNGSILLCTHALHSYSVWYISLSPHNTILENGTKWIFPKFYLAIWQLSIHGMESNLEVDNLKDKFKHKTLFECWLAASGYTSGGKNKIKFNAQSNQGLSSNKFCFFVDDVKEN